MARQENGGVQAKEGSVRERTLFKNKKKFGCTFYKKQINTLYKKQSFF